jgi:hypothetical protein
MLLPQELAQLPQLALSVLRSISQPFIVLPSQLPWPALHMPIAQVLLMQAGVALAMLHCVPHEPQLFTDVAMLVSQPFAALPSQLAKVPEHTGLV